MRNMLQAASGGLRAALRPISQSHHLHHRDVFPLPAPARSSPLSTHLPRYLFQRLKKAKQREALVEESVRPLNALALANARAGPALTEAPTRGMTSAQASVVSRVGHRIAALGSPKPGNEHEALLELLKVKDLYEGDS